MRRLHKTALALTIAAALTTGTAATATAAVGGPEGYVGTKTGPGIANIYVSQLSRTALNTTVDINVTGKPYVGKINGTLRKPNGTVLARRTIDLHGKRVYQIAWGYDRTFKKGEKYVMTASVPAAYGHKAANLTGKTLTIK